MRLMFNFIFNFAYLPIYKINSTVNFHFDCSVCFGQMFHGNFPFSCFAQSENRGPLRFISPKMRFQNLLGSPLTIKCKAAWRLIFDFASAILSGSFKSGPPGVAVILIVG